MSPKRRNRRSSLRKLCTTQDINTNSSCDENSPNKFKTKRRVSFAEKKHIKKFCHSTEQGTVWDNTYEEHDVSHKEIDNQLHTSTMNVNEEDNNPELNETCCQNMSMEFTTAVPMYLLPLPSDEKENQIRNLQTVNDLLCCGNKSQQNILNVGDAINCNDVSMEITQPIPVSITSIGNTIFNTSMQITASVSSTIYEKKNTEALNIEVNAEALNTEINTEMLNAEVNTEILNAEEKDEMLNKINTEIPNAEVNTEALNIEVNAEALNIEINTEMLNAKVNTEILNAEENDEMLNKVNTEISSAEVNTEALNIEVNAEALNIEINTEMLNAKVNTEILNAEENHEMLNKVNTEILNAEENDEMLNKVNTEIPSAEVSTEALNIKVNTETLNIEVNAEALNTEIPNAEVNSEALNTKVNTEVLNIETNTEILNAEVTTEIPNAEVNTKAWNTEVNTEALNTEINTEMLNAELNTEILNAEENHEMLNKVNTEILNAEENDEMLNKVNTEILNAEVTTEIPNAEVNTKAWNTEVNTEALNTEINTEMLNAELNTEILNAEENNEMLNKANIEIPNAEGNTEALNTKVHTEPLNTEVNTEILNVEVNTNVLNTEVNIKEKQCSNAKKEVEAKQHNITNIPLVEENWFSLLVKKIETYAESDDCIWYVYKKNIHKKRIAFGFIRNSLLIVLSLSKDLNCSEQSFIKNTKVISLLADNAGIHPKIVHGLILEKINAQELMNMYKTCNDILPMLDFVSQDVKLAMDFIYDLKQLDNLNLMDITLDKISFVSLSEDLDIILKVTINIKRFDKLTPNDINICCLLGMNIIRENYIKDLIINVQKDHKFLRRYMDDVKKYVDIMEKYINR